MSGYEHKSRAKTANCGCGGRGVVWVHPDEWGRDGGVISAMCSKHCGIKMLGHAYGPLPLGYLPEVKAASKVRRKWNRAMTGKPTA